MMQRVLHVSSEFDGMSELISEKFMIEDTVRLGGITAVTVSYDSFSALNTGIYDLILNISVRICFQIFVQKFKIS